MTRCTQQRLADELGVSQPQIGIYRRRGLTDDEIRGLYAGATSCRHCGGPVSPKPAVGRQPRQCAKCRAAERSRDQEQKRVTRRASSLRCAIPVVCGLCGKVRKVQASGRRLPALCNRCAPAAKTLGRVGFIYFVECAGRVKVGFSTEPAKRLTAIQANAPHPVELLALFETTDLVTEFVLHGWLNAHRLHFEWFAAAPARELIRVLVEAGNPNVTGAMK